MKQLCFFAAILLLASSCNQFNGVNGSGNIIKQAITTGNLGWKSLERGEYNRCIELSKKALELDNTLVFVHYNLGLAYLLKGQSSDAIRVYTKAITLTKKLPNPKENFQAAINDITTYQNKCTSKEDTKDIYDILLAEYNKYE